MSKFGCVLTVSEAKRRARQGRKPAADLGYCKCGTAWNMPALGAKCPDCRKKPIYIEEGKERFSLLGKP